MSTKQQLKDILNEVFTGYDLLVGDLQEPSGTRTDVLARNKARFEIAKAKVEALLDPTIPDLIITIVDGDIQDVHAQYPGLTYIIIDPGLEVDLDDVQKSGETFAKKHYEAFIDKLVEEFSPTDIVADVEV